MRGRDRDNIKQILLIPTVTDSSSGPRLFLKSAPVNVLSCRNKTVQIHYIITDNEFDVLFITQTWLSDQGDEACNTEMRPKGYQFHSFTRCSTRGGSIALVSKCSTKSVSVKRLNYQCLEAVQVKLLHISMFMSFVCLYRPPPSKVDKFTDKMFLDELSGLVVHLASRTGEMVTVGDFHYHFLLPVPT